MKQILLFTCLLVATAVNAQDLLWAKSFGGAGPDRSESITVDASGNVYTAGYFDGTVDFDSGVGTTSLTSNGARDVFVQKMDASGNLLWAQSFGGADQDYGYSITLDASGNVYTTGEFRGTVDFNPGVGTTNLTSNGGADVFVQKMDSSGNFLWAKSFGGSSSDGGFSATVDALGNVYTIGRFKGTVDFDPGAGITNLTSNGLLDVFMQKMDSSGNFLWAKSFGGADNDFGFSATVDASGNVYTAGYFDGTVDFDPGAGITNLTSNGLLDVFVQKMDSSGNFLWAKSFGGADNDFGWSITVDASGNVYATGEFRGTVDFDPGVGTTNLTSNGGADVFVQKMDPLGNLMWAKSFGGTVNAAVRCITLDAFGNVYTTGAFGGIVDFDPGVGTTNLTSNGGGDVFVQKMDSSGNFLWAKSFGGTDAEAGYSITVDASGNVYTTGEFRGTVDFNPGVGTANLTSNGIIDGFVQKLSQCSSNLTISQSPNSTICAGDIVQLTVAQNSPTWGLYYENDFESTVSSEWSPSTTFNYNGGVVLGRFGNSTTALNLTGLPTHDSIRVEFDLYIADTWDGNGGGPDTWGLTMGGSNVINATFAACCTGSNGGQSYPDNIPASNDAETGATITGLPDFYGSGDGTDLYQIVRSAPNTGSTYTIQFTGSGLQNLNDESWAIDNVKIYLYSNNVVSGIQWSTGSTESSITATPTETTTYSVTVDNGITTCTDSVTVTVSNPTVDLGADTLGLCAGDSILLDAGAGYNYYDWSTGDTTQSIYASSTGNYSVTIGEANCTATDSVYVDALNAQIIQNDTTICAGNTIQLSVNQPGISDNLNPNIAYGSVSDIEGNDYATVAIDNQVWMAENLRTATYSNGDPIPQVQNNIDWGAINYGAWCVRTAPDWESTYGKLYNHRAVRETRNICPAGWHVPFISEWDTLIAVLGDPIEVGGELKSTGTQLWDSPNVGASNSVGFSGLPAGLRSGFFGSVNFSGEGSNANWWTADIPTLSGANPKYKRIRASDGILDRLGRPGRSGLSVRCIKDDTTAQAYNSAQYLWSNGSTQAGISVSPTETTIYTVTVTNGISTCTDSVVVTVLPLSADTVQQTVCEPYTWAQTGLTYNNSGFYSDTVSVAANCDSIYVLELTIQNQPPVITCLPDIDAQTSDDGSGDCTTTAVISNPGVSDDCDVPTVTAQINGSIINPNTYNFPVGVTEIQWVAADNAGNTDTCFQEVNVFDDEFPAVVSCPLGVQLDNDPGECGAIVTFTDATFSDNCSGLQVNLTGGLPSGSLFPIGLTTVVYTATDVGGNETSCQIPIVVNDVELPTFTGCPNDTVISASPLSCNANFVYPSVDVNDNCPGTTLHQLGIPSGGLFPLGVSVVSWIATDTIGNADTCSFTVEVIDDLPPYFLNCPNDITAELGLGTCNGIVSWDPIQYDDNCSATITQTSGIANGGTFPIGITVNEFVIEDPSGNSDTCTFWVTITDTIAPSIVCPSNIEVNNQGTNCGPQVVNYNPPSSTDNCTAVTNVLIEGLPSGSVFPLGVTNISFEASDNSGNKDTCSFTITVNDPLPPPGDIDTIFGPVEICNSVSPFYSVNGVPNALDYIWTIVGGTIDVNATGSNATNKKVIWGPQGQGQVIVQAVNNCYQSTPDTLQVTIYDAPSPVDAGIDSTTLCQPITDYTLQAIPPIIGIGEWSVVEGGATIISPLDPNSDVVGLSADTNIFRWTVTNAICSGFSDTYVIPDAENPVAICQDLVRYVPPSGSFTLTAADVDGGSTDNCVIESMSLSQSTFTCTSVGIATTELIVTDSLGNVGTCEANITIVDTIAPTAICQDITVQLNGLGEYTLEAQEVNGGSLDNCIIDSVLVEPSFFNCTNIGANSVTLIVVDESGNRDSCDAVVTIQDTDGPTINACNNATLYLDSAGTVVLDPNTLFSAIPTDPCGLASITTDVSQNTFTCDDVGPNVVTVTATDDNGNSSTCSSIVTVVDDISPVAMCTDMTFTLDSTGIIEITDAYIFDSGSWDSCGITQFVAFPAVFDCDDIGVNTVTITMTDANGNSSTCTPNVTILSDFTSTSDTTVCDSFTWNGATYTTGGTYTFQTLSNTGCDSTATLNLTILNSTTSTTDVTECDEYTWNNQTYTQSGTYTFQTTNSEGCDSTATLNLTILNSTTSTTDTTVCDSFTWNGATYTTGGTYTFQTLSNTGCDSTATLNLTILNSTTSTTDVTECDEYTWNNQTYTQSGTYTFQTTNSEGCDSTATLNLTILNSTTSTTDTTVCDSFTWNGATYTTGGTYTFQTLSNTGCDSTATLNLTILNSTTSTTDVTECDEYTWNNQTYTQSGTYTFQTTNSEGCDSTATLNLTILNSTTSTTDTTVCDSFTWNGATYTTGGTYTFQTLSNTGCDSTATLNLTILNSTTSTTDITECDEYTWNNQTYTQSGTYTFQTTNSEGCDSTATLNLTILNSTTSTTDITECDEYTWNNQTYTQSGTYTFQSTNAEGCDSTATLNLTILNSTTSTTDVTECDEYTWNNQTYTQSGTYTFQTTNSEGCDSTATLNLTILNSTTSTTDTTVCDSFTWNGATYTTGGTYTFQTLSNTGCDSTATLNLTILNSTTSTTDITECDEYTWNNQTYTQSGTYTFQSTNAEGCDSTATLNLTILNSTTSTTDITECDEYTWNNQTYTQSGTYTFQSTNAEGCDSTATLNLTINNSTFGPTQAVSGCGSATLNGETWTVSGVYTQVLTNAAGCDSTITVAVTIDEATTSSTDVTECDEYTWNGTTYTTSGSYTFQTTNSAGCDSTATLNLTINNSTNGPTQAVSGCGSATLNGETWTVSGVYTQVLTNAAGCDSTITVAVTIDDATTSTTDVTECDEYTWNGTTYTTSGSYTFQTTNSAGCDSTATLNLTIGYTTENVTDLAICQGDTVTVNGEDYTESTTIIESYPNQFGCDSTVIINIMVEDPAGFSISGPVTAFSFGSATYWISQPLGNYEVNWNLYNGNILSGQGTSNINVQWGEIGFGQVIAELSNGVCTVYDTLNIGAVGISELSDEGWMIVPNPSTGQFEITSEKRNRDVEIYVYDALGGLVYVDDAENTNRLVVDITDLANGAYLVRLVHDEGMFTKRLIKN